METSRSALRVAIVGCGDMGHAHVAAWQSSGCGVIEAVIDIDAQRRTDLAGRAGARAYADYREALVRARIDVASVCVPAAGHAEVSVFALQQGLSVLCEKPIASSLEDARRIQAAAAAGKSPGVLAVAFQYRHSHVLKHLAQALKDSRIGRPVVYDLRVQNTIRDKLAMHRQRDNGGPFVDVLCHWIDQWRLLFGCEVVRVMARGLTYARENDPALAALDDLAVDTGVVLLEFASGDLATVHLTWGLPKALRSHSVRQESLVGPRAIIRVHLKSDAIEIIDASGVCRCEGPPWPQGSSGQGMRAQMMRAFAAAVSTGAPPGADAGDGVAALTVSHAILRSMETAEAVVLNQ